MTPVALQPQFLLEEIEARESGVGAPMNIPQGVAALNVTLGITRVLQQECLDVIIWGASEMNDWTRLACFHNKCYCGSYTMPLSLIDLRGDRAPITQLRVEWTMSRWSQPSVSPLFGFFVAIEEPRHNRAGAA